MNKHENRKSELSEQMGMMNTKELIDENDSRSNWKEHKHSANVCRPVCSVQKISNKFPFP